MSNKPPNDRRITWLIIGLGFNTIISLTAIALWVFAPNPGNAKTTPDIDQATSVTADQSRPSLSPSRHRRPSGFTPPYPPDKLPGSAPIRAAIGEFSKGQPRGPISASTTSLAERLHLRADALSETLGDETGEIPKSYASRLERAFDTATSLAKRRGLDESQTQSVVALVTYYAFSLLREEKNAAPNSPDATRIEEMTNEILTDIRTTCGEDTRAAAAIELEKL